MRLRRGDFADETVFGDDPVAMAKSWVGEGARYLHVVDLDGAREGEPRNFDLIRAHRRGRARCRWRPAAASGPRRRSSWSRQSLVAKVVLGTSAVEDQAFVQRALELLGPGRVVVAIDAEDGLVKTRGWQEQSDVTVLDLAARPGGAWACAEILYTDISRDGMMQSVNLDGPARAGGEERRWRSSPRAGSPALDDLRG